MPNQNQANRGRETAPTPGLSSSQTDQLLHGRTTWLLPDILFRGTRGDARFNVLCKEAEQLRLCTAMQIPDTYATLHDGLWPLTSREGTSPRPQVFLTSPEEVIVSISFLSANLKNKQTNKSNKPRPREVLSYL